MRDSFICKCGKSGTRGTGNVTSKGVDYCNMLCYVRYNSEGSSNTKEAEVAS